MQRLPTLDLILVRHAEPVAAAPDWVERIEERPLTDAGRAAAEALADELEPYRLTAVYSSPYPRAFETVQPTAARRGLEVQLLDDLRERVLVPEAEQGWSAALEQAWGDFDYAPSGGETGRDAQRRAIAILDLLRSRHAEGGTLLVGSHGNLISLILHALEPEVDFVFHMAMPTPAVYHLAHDGIGWRVMGGHGFAATEQPDPQ